MLVPYALGEFSPESRAWHRIRRHLSLCRRCDDEYHECKSMVEFIQGHRQEFARAVYEYDGQTTGLASSRRHWRHIEARLDRMQPAWALARRIPSAIIRHRVLAAAACLAASLCLWWFFARNESHHAFPQEQELRQATRPLTIELLTEEGAVPIQPGSPVVATDEVEQLIINHRHTILVRANTQLCVKPYREGGVGGCLVELRLGEVFAHVEHDGNLFAISTTHGKATVTGTSFGVQATATALTLVVTEGSVQLASESAAVRVLAGQMSTAAAGGDPSPPEKCDVHHLLAWAMPSATRLASGPGWYSGSFPRVANLSAGDVLAYFDLEKTDSVLWRHRRRGWFEREFPWIFRLQEALGAEGIATDYARLLVETGDIWQFAVPALPSDSIARPSLQTLCRAAAGYGLDDEWLRQSVAALQDPAPGPGTPQSRPAATFAEWAACFEKARGSPGSLSSNLLLGSLHAGTYLLNTRALIWLSMKDAEKRTGSDDNGPLCELLYDQVTVAGGLVEKFLLLLAAAYDQPCDEYWALMDAIHQDISRLLTLEQRIGESRDGQI